MIKRTQSFSRRHLWWPLMILSGMAALMYEICWIRMFALGLGHEMPAMAGVLSAFFGGLALGGWALDRKIRQTAKPVGWYVVLELLIGTWAIVTTLAIPWINRHLGTWTGPTPSPTLHWLLAFMVPLVALSPATIAMGATVPTMDQIVHGLRGSSRWIGAIYAANTLGAVAGTIATTFLLLPALGFTKTLYFAAAINFLCAGGAYLCFASLRRDASTITTMESVPLGKLASLLFATGVLGIGYEVLGTRVMAQVQENTVYSFASVLSVYLLGTAAGAAAYQRWLVHRDQARVLVQSLGLLTAATFLGTVVVGWSPMIHRSTLLSLGPGLGPAVTTEVILATAVFALPSFLMGMTCSTLAQIWRDACGSVGTALGINTLGAALAAPLFAPIVLPLLGAKWSLLSVSLGYMALFVLCVRSAVCAPASDQPSSSPHKHRRVRAARESDQPVNSGYRLTLLIGALAVWAITTDLAFVAPIDGGEVLDYRDGVLASVAVVTDRDDNRFLKVNDRFRMGGTNRWTNERRLGHIPLLLHPQPHAVLFLGLGTGNTLAAAVDHPGLQATAVELVPEVVQVQRYFESSTGDLAGDPDIEILVGDARRYVQATDVEYDVIVADLFHPARDGSGSLYTREHFQAIRERLRRQGLFCQWLPLYQMDTDCLRIIVSTFLDVFPECTAYLSTLDVNQPILGLMGRIAPQSYGASWFNDRLANTKLREQVMRAGLVNDFALFGLAVASTDRLRSFAANVPIVTDNHARVTFVAPHFIYSRQTPGYVPLLALLDTHMGSGLPQTPSASIADSAFAQRVLQFELARNRFLQAERFRLLGQLPQAWEGYLESTSISRDFILAPAVVTMQAQRLAQRGKATQAMGLLNRLLAVRPHDATAREILQRIERAVNAK